MLRTLTNAMRPIVEFDASNQEHRKLYYNFLSTGSWGRCPYRFTVNNDFGIVKGIIDRRLIEYYMNSEFVNQEIRV